MPRPVEGTSKKYNLMYICNESNETPKNLILIGTYLSITKANFHKFFSNYPFKIYF